ncbi:MAG TPA: hypothetical protein VKP67_07520 [Xanthobacteraceae bacterium]|nr:hypothetical protein [Xanthobacteraceae bacterium]
MPIEVARLPEADQEATASLIPDEIAAERGWDERFAKTQDQLGALVRAARAEVARGSADSVVRLAVRASDFARYRSFWKL